MKGLNAGTKKVTCLNTLNSNCYTLYWYFRITLQSNPVAESFQPDTANGEEPADLFSEEETNTAVNSSITTSKSNGVHSDNENDLFAGMLSFLSFIITPTRLKSRIGSSPCDVLAYVVSPLRGLGGAVQGEPQHHSQDLWSWIHPVTYTISNTTQVYGAGRLQQDMPNKFHHSWV